MVNGSVEETTGVTVKPIAISIFCTLLFSLLLSDLRAAVLQRDVELPISDNAGSEVRAHVRICEPDVSTPHPVVLFVHGDPGDGNRPKAELPACNDEISAWFTRRGF